MTVISKLFIYGARSQKSQALIPALEVSAAAAGIELTKSPSEADMAVCVGGDGTLLRMLREYDFPPLPIAGVNTGHLGFFQEAENALRRSRRGLQFCDGLGHHA